jgi:hypothetical protein
LRQGKRELPFSELMCNTEESFVELNRKQFSQEQSRDLNLGEHLNICLKIDENL